MIDIENCKTSAEKLFYNPFLLLFALISSYKRKEKISCYERNKVPAPICMYINIHAFNWKPFMDLARVVLCKWNYFHSAFPLCQATHFLRWILILAFLFSFLLNSALCMVTHLYTILDLFSRHVPNIKWAF